MEIGKCYKSGYFPLESHLLNICQHTLRLYIYQVFGFYYALPWVVHLYMFYSLARLLGI